jgi:TRAP-type C4-dicarboxylate transport system permease large subunit
MAYAALAATSGVIGAIIPPSMVMVVWCDGGGMIGGFFSRLPGLLYGLLMLVVKLHGIIRHFRRCATGDGFA